MKYVSILDAKVKDRVMFLDELYIFMMKSSCGINYKNIQNFYTCGFLAAVLMRCSGTKQHEMKMSNFEYVRPRSCPDVFTSPSSRLSFQK